MQASSGLFYDVFRKYDPANGLLKQAEREVLEDELDVEAGTGDACKKFLRLSSRRSCAQAPDAFCVSADG